MSQLLLSKVVVWATYEDGRIHKNTQPQGLIKEFTFINFYSLFWVEEFKFFISTTSYRKFRNKLWHISLCSITLWVDLAHEYNTTSSPTNTSICYIVPFHTIHDKNRPDKSELLEKKAKKTVENQEITQSFDKKC